MPLIVLSARRNEAVKTDVLDLGADAHITKPFSVNDLLSRLRAAVRRGEASTTVRVVDVGPLQIDLSRKKVARDGVDVPLTPTAWAFIELLTRHLGRLVPRKMCLQQVWGPSALGQTHYLRV